MPKLFKKVSLKMAALEQECHMGTQGSRIPAAAQLSTKHTHDIWYGLSDMLLQFSARPMAGMAIRLARVDTQHRAKEHKTAALNLVQRRHGGGPSSFHITC